jgi:2-dehydro-3-deoxyphosphogluconate aldolase/(4S)-4-hydroxy-2-oxoglutarate aldolase
MDSNAVLRKIGEVGIVPVIRCDSVDHTLRAVEALHAGGISIAEITMTVPDAVRAIAAVARQFGDSVLVGAGTVTRAADAQNCIDAGAQFLVSPGLSNEVLQLGHEKDVLVIPGAFTPTEVMSALEHNARVLKLFPCSSGGGVTHLKALRGPFPGVSFIPTGGVNASNAAEYIAAGAFALGAGGDLVDRSALKNGDLQRITGAARQFLSAITAARDASHNHKPSPTPAA